MIRRVAIRPNPQTGMVDREAHVQAFMDLEAQMWISGGVGSVVVDRARTDAPGEMVTTFAVVEWKDRTDAKPSPEPETHDLAGAGEQTAQGGMEALAAPLESLSEQLGVPVEELAARITQAAPLPQPEPQPVPVPAGSNGDAPEGADELEEDLSSIPEHLR